MFDLRLIHAETLKLRRRRGMVALCGGVLLLAVAGYLIAVAVGDGPAGGVTRFDTTVGLLGMLASVVGVIIGSTAGAAVIEAGVWRDLVATGRSRTALFGARVPGAWALVLPMLVIALAVAAVWCTVLADSASPAPGTRDIVDGAASVLVSGAFSAAVCVGLAALTGNRGPVIGAALAFQLGISPLLAEIDALGEARHAIPQMAIARLGDAGDLAQEFSLAAAVLILLTWCGAALAAGAWRAQTQEI